MVTVWQGLTAVTKAFTIINDHWPAIILSAGDSKTSAKETLEIVAKSNAIIKSVIEKEIMIVDLEMTLNKLGEDLKKTRLVDF